MFSRRKSNVFVIMLIIIGSILISDLFEGNLILQTIDYSKENIWMPATLWTKSTPLLCTKFMNGTILNNTMPIHPLIGNNTPHYNRIDLGIRFKNPLYLYSEGGSGNTWMRILLEYVTGISSGDPFNDIKFDNIFNNEGYCYNGLLICKAHPRWFYRGSCGDFKRVNSGHWKNWSNKTHLSDGLIWIIRNPWYSMWSLYQLQFNNFKDHAGRIKRIYFNKNLFKNTIFLGTNELSLVEHWKQQFLTVNALFNDSNRNWKNNEYQTDNNHNNNEFKGRIVVIKYENLLNKNQRINVIMKIINHLYVLDRDVFIYPTKDGLVSITLDELKQRILCAFQYTDNMKNVKSVKRNKNNNDTDFVSMEYAYLSLGKETICNIWNSLKHYAQPLGYKQLFIDKFDCDKMNIVYKIVDNINHANITHCHGERKRRKAEKERLNKLYLQMNNSEQVNG